MNERRKIEDKLRRKEQEIAALEDQIKDARVYVQALQDVLKLLPRDSEAEGGADTILRSGSMVAQARNIIKAKAIPVHVDEILRILGKAVNRENKAALSGSLAAYVRRGEIFTRPAPNTYGLVELEPQSSPQSPQPASEPPPNFGDDSLPDPLS
jgi:N-glycosylase/DNA lyase